MRDLKWKKINICGECIPCKCLKSTLIDLYCDNNTSEEDKEYYRNFLKDKFLLLLIY